MGQKRVESQFHLCTADWNAQEQFLTATWPKKVSAVQHSAIRIFSQDSKTDNGASNGLTYLDVNILKETNQQSLEKSFHNELNLLYIIYYSNWIHFLLLNYELSSNVCLYLCCRALHFISHHSSVTTKCLGCLGFVVTVTPSCRSLSFFFYFRWKTSKQ